MKQFDVCENRLISSRARAPFLLLLQSDFLRESPICIVAPLVNATEIEPIRRLNPTFTVNGRSLVLSILEIAGLRRSALGKSIANLESQRDEIIAALDMLFTGI